MTQAVPDSANYLQETFSPNSEENFYFEISSKTNRFCSKMTNVGDSPAMTSQPPPYPEAAPICIKTMKDKRRRNCFSDWTTDDLADKDILKKDNDAIVPDDTRSYLGSTSTRIKPESCDHEHGPFNLKRESTSSEDFYKTPTYSAYTPSPNSTETNIFYEQDSFDRNKHNFSPSDPYTWQFCHVRAWLSWVAEEFALPHFDLLHFPQIDGESLCAMNLNDFMRFTTQYNGEVLMYQLKLLQQDRRCSWKEVDAVEDKDTLEDIYKILGPVCAKLCKQGGGQIQLWQFLMELLGDFANSTCIAWESINGEFKMVDPDEVARRWGERKSKPNMNYDKMSRALRYYYDKNIMTKVHGKRYAYKFDFHGLAQTLHSGSDQDKFDSIPNQINHLPTYNESLQQGYFSYPDPSPYCFASPTSENCSELGHQTFSFGPYHGFPHSTEYNNRNSWSDSSSVASGHYGYDLPSSELYKPHSCPEQSYPNQSLSHQCANTNSFASSSGYSYNPTAQDCYKLDSATRSNHSSTSTDYWCYNAHAQSTLSMASQSAVTPHYFSGEFTPTSEFHHGVQSQPDRGFY